MDLGPTTEQPIETFAVVTTNLFSILEMHKPRQTQVYQVCSLQGTAGLA
jgi:Mlc titration factor MtfA (ptsG expression regulator)